MLGLDGRLLSKYGSLRTDILTVTNVKNMVGSVDVEAAKDGAEGLNSTSLGLLLVLSVTHQRSPCLQVILVHEPPGTR